jgi:uncharacterized peroxidase-related enzyme
MARIQIPTPEQAPEKSKPKLDAVKAKLGSAPNLFRIMANSPATLEGYLGLNGALGAGSLDLKTRERIALAVAEVNGCGYCLSAHTYIGLNMAKMDEADVQAARNGRSRDALANAAVELAVALARGHGRVTDAQFNAARRGGLSDAQILEVIANVALNVMTNYVNLALETDIDFPVVSAARAA